MEIAINGLRDRLKESLVMAGCRVVRTMHGDKRQRTLMGCRDGIDFIVNERPGELLEIGVTMQAGWDALLDSLREVGIGIMLSDPLCECTIKKYGERLFYRSLYWATEQSYELLFQLANQTGEFANATIPDLRFIGEHHLEDYRNPQLVAEMEHEASLRRQYYGILGLDPGDCDIRRVEQASELELFVDLIALTSDKQAMIQNLDELWTIMERAVGPEQTKVWLEPLAKHLGRKYDTMIDYVSYRVCQKIDVECYAPTYFGRIRAKDDEELNRWLSFYSDRLNELYTDEDLKRLFELRAAGESLKQFEPLGNWRRYDPKRRECL